MVFWAIITPRVIKNFRSGIKIIWNEWTHISTNVEHTTHLDRYVHLVEINLLKFKDLWMASSWEWLTKKAINEKLEKILNTHLEAI